MQISAGVFFTFQGVAKSLCHHARLRMTGIIGGKRKVTVYNNALLHNYCQRFLQKFIRESLYNPTDIVVATLGTLQKYLIRGVWYKSGVVL